MVEVKNILKDYNMVQTSFTVAFSERYISSLGVHRLKQSHKDIPLSVYFLQYIRCSN